MGGARGRLSILIHHRVVPSRDEMMPDVPTVEEFDRHVALITRVFNVLPLAMAVRALRAGRLPPRALAVTFDDGYADNEALALPVLRRHHCPATFFVATAYLDGGRMFNDSVIEAVRIADGVLDCRDLGLGAYVLSGPTERRAAIASLIDLLKYRRTDERASFVSALAERVRRPLPTNLMMTRAQVRSLAAAGMEVGGHTVTHPILARCDAAEAEREIADGRDELAAICGQPVELFAYPNGRPLKDYTADHVRIVRRLGFGAAVSTCWGAASAASDPFQLPRFTPWQKSPAPFLAQLLANYRKPPQLPVELMSTASQGTAMG
jgi:peptidoglycan/xylan/chitin deacetylase (PgdA/CDA1 family)